MKTREEETIEKLILKNKNATWNYQITKEKGNLKTVKLL